MQDMSINVALKFQPSSRQALHIRGMLRELKGDFLGAVRDYQGWASWMDLTCAEAQQVNSLVCIQTITHSLFCHMAPFLHDGTLALSCNLAKIYSIFGSSYDLWCQPTTFGNCHTVYMQLLEACNKQEQFAHLGALGINAALLSIEGDAPCSQHVLYAAVASPCSSSLWQTPAFASCLHYKTTVHGTAVTV